MLVLGLDSAGGACAVCVWQDGVPLALKVEAMERGQDSRLIPLVQEAMAEAGLRSYGELDRIAVTRGPGSFTGIRIALASARALGFAARKPVIGVDRFSLLRKRAAQRPLLIVLESRRAELYVAFGASEAPPLMLLPEEILSLLQADPALAVTGDGAAPLQGMIAPERILTSSEPEVLEACSMAASADPALPCWAALPLYIRAPDVTLGKKGKGSVAG